MGLPFPSFIGSGSARRKAMNVDKWRWGKTESILVTSMHKQPELNMYHKREVSSKYWKVSQRPHWVIFLWVKERGDPERKRGGS